MMSSWSRTHCLLDCSQLMEGVQSFGSGEVLILPGPNPASLGQLALPTESKQDAFESRFLPVSEMPLSPVTCQSPTQ